MKHTIVFMYLELRMESIIEWKAIPMFYSVRPQKGLVDPNMNQVAAKKEKIP